MGPLRRTTRFARGLVIGTALTIAACRTPSHREAELNAQQHWTGVRANIKLQLAEQAYESKQFDEAVRLASESIALNWIVGPGSGQPVSGVAAPSNGPTIPAGVAMAPAGQS